MLKGFKDFLQRGNVVDLAVAVVIGAAFTAVIDAVVKGLITPLVAAVFGKTDLSKVGNFTVNNAQFSLGLVLDAAFRFLCVAAAVYFLIVLPINRLAALRKRGVEPEPEAPTEEIIVLTEIRDALRTR
jgi:large conductance mechanosensitive channel